MMMNERIRELGRQSGLIQYDTDSKLVEVDKFAELIVKECITKSVEICMNRVQGDCWKNNQADIEALRYSQDIQRELPKHFGIEL